MASVMHRCVGAGVVYGVDVGVALGFSVGVDLGIGVGVASWHRCWGCDEAVLELRLGVTQGVGVGVGLWRRCRVGRDGVGVGFSAIRYGYSQLYLESLV